MNIKLDPLLVDRRFFTSLIDANLPALDQVLAHDFILIDVMRIRGYKVLPARGNRFTTSQVRVD
jgi:hypothetical protein